MIQPIFESATVHEKALLEKQIVKVERKTDVYSSEVEKILSQSASSFINDSRIENGQIKWNGKVIFYLCYLSREGEVKKCEYSEEFTGKLALNENLNAISVFTDARVNLSRADKSQNTVVLTAEVNVSNQVEYEHCVNALTGGENLVAKTCECIKLSSLGCNRTVYPIEEQFDIPSQVAEVLTQSVDSVITGVQSGVGCIIVDGEALFTAIVLQKNQKDDIIKINKAFPFRVEIESEGAVPALKCSADSRVRSLKVEIAVDEDQQRSQAQVSINLEFFGSCYTETAMNLCSDLFSLTSKVDFDTKKVDYTYPLTTYSFEKEVITGASVEELPIGALVVALTDTNVECLSVEKDCDSVTLSGVINASLLIKAQDEYMLKNLSSPFVIKTDTDDYSSSSIKATLVVKDAKVRIVTLDSVEIIYETIITLSVLGVSHIEVIEKVNEGEAKKENESAISVYIPEPDEELWSLAKRLNRTPEDLIKTNKDLCFPLTGDERIVVYRQK